MRLTKVKIGDNYGRLTVIRCVANDQVEDPCSSVAVAVKRKVRDQSLPHDRNRSSAMEWA
jgi:hypothetical protein